MSPDVGFWLLIGLWASAMVFGMVQVRKFWRDARSVPAWNGVPGWWPLGDALWRGTVRSCAVWVALGSVGAVLLAVAEVGGWRDPSVTLTGAETVIVDAVSGVAILLLGLMVTVILVNRPTVVVPAHLRSEPGAAEEWWQATRRWSARVEGEPVALKPLLFVVFVLTGQTVRARNRRAGQDRERPQGH